MGSVALEAEKKFDLSRTQLIDVLANLLNNSDLHVNDVAHLPLFNLDLLEIETRQMGRYIGHL